MARRGLASLLATGLVLVCAPAAGAALTPNLVANPGAEAGAASPFGAVVPSIPGWQRDPVYSNNSTVVRYGSPGFLTVDDSRAIDGGSAFFAGGPANLNDIGGEGADRAYLQQQEIPIPATHANIVKAGGGMVTLSACLGGYGDQADSARVALWFHSIGPAASSPDMTIVGPGPVERGTFTSLQPRTQTVRIDPSTEALGVELELVRASGATTYNDGYADNVSVRIGQDGTDTAPPPNCRPGKPGPGPGAPAPKPPPNTDDSGSNTAVPLQRVGKRVTLGRAYAKLKLRCVARDSNCKGSVSLKTRTTRLGSARFKIASGKSATVKVKLKRSARKRLAHLSRKRLAKLKVIAIAKIGKETTRFTLGAKR